MQVNQDTFYLNLPSNGYDTIYRDNTPGRFKAKLLKTISLPGREWEVALSSISLPIPLQYLPIRKNVFDSVEVRISETDGSQVNFKDGQTILTINFRRSGGGSLEMSTQTQLSKCASAKRMSQDYKYEW